MAVAEAAKVSREVAAAQTLSNHLPKTWHVPLAGAMGGVCATAMGHPFDIVKVKLQAQKQLPAPQAARWPPLRQAKPEFRGA